EEVQRVPAGAEPSQGMMHDGPPPTAAGFSCRRSIRHAHATGLGLLSIQQLHWQARPDIFREPDTAALREFFLSRLQDGGSHILIVVAEGRPVGFLSAEYQARKANAFRLDSSVLYIHQIAVDPSAQTAGVGSKLMSAAVDCAVRLNATGLRLDAWTFNTAAHRFFEGHDFTAMNITFERELP
ncbi:GNAT family N-acetyltransferase, partial [Rhodococcus erythropolis]|uniref:GNAT family N-acetyltransferase n=1 Tax=Rhodococcus erythropolis TaxID=1833 RepID=UPI00294A2556